MLRRCFCCGAFSFFETLSLPADNRQTIVNLFNWIVVGGLNVSFSYQVDQLSLVMAMIVTGVGFLGAGVIWKTKFELTGLTTAACMWTSAAIGVAVGAGMFALAVSGTLLITIILLLKPILIKYEQN